MVETPTSLRLFSSFVATGHNYDVKLAFIDFIKFFLTSMKPLKYATDTATVLDRIFSNTNTEH